MIVEWEKPTEECIRVALLSGAMLISAVVVVPVYMGWVCRHRGRAATGIVGRILRGLLAGGVAASVAIGLAQGVPAALALWVDLMALGMMGACFYVPAWAAAFAATLLVTMRLGIARDPSGRRDWARWPAGLLLASLAVGVSFSVVQLQRELWRLDSLKRNPRNLDAIGRGLDEYWQRHGRYPVELRELVDYGVIQPTVLTEANSSYLITPGRPYRGSCFFSYHRLPADAPKDLVWAWLDPREHSGHGGYVLYRSGNVHWKSDRELAAEVERTQQWLTGALNVPLSRLVVPAAGFR